MVVSGTFLTVVLGSAALLLAKQLASRSYYKEIQQPRRFYGWHNDPTCPDPRLGREGTLQLWSAANEDQQTEDAQRIFLNCNDVSESYRNS